MPYIVIQRYKILIKVIPKNNFTNICLVLSKIIGMYDESFTNIVNNYQIKINTIINNEIYQEKYNYKYLYSFDINSYKNYTKIITVRDPFERVVSGITYLIKYENIIKNPKTKIIDFYFNHFKNHHLNTQITDLDVKIKWDYCYDITDFNKLMTTLEQITNISLKNILLTEKHKSVYGSSTEKIRYIGDFRNTKNINKNINLLFTDDEISKIKKVLEKDIIFYEKNIKNSILY